MKTKKEMTKIEVYNKFIKGSEWCKATYSECDICPFSNERNYGRLKKCSTAAREWYDNCSKEKIIDEILD